MKIFSNYHIFNLNPNLIKSEEIIENKKLYFIKNLYFYIDDIIEYVNNKDFYLNYEHNFLRCLNYRCNLYNSNLQVFSKHLLKDEENIKFNSDFNDNCYLLEDKLNYPVMFSNHTDQYKLYVCLYGKIKIQLYSNHETCFHQLNTKEYIQLFEDKNFNEYYIPAYEYVLEANEAMYVPCNAYRNIETMTDYSLLQDFNI